MVHDYPPITGGGLALSVQELVRLFDGEAGFVVLTSRLADHFADDRERFAAAGAPDNLALATAGRALRSLRAADAVVIHWTFSFRRLATLFLLAAPALGRPTVAVVHTAPAHCLYNRLRRLPPPARRLLVSIARAMLRRATVTVALGPAHAAALAERHIRADRVLPIPVTATVEYRDARRARARERRDPQTVGIVGELSRLKGADDLPRLMRSLTPEFAFRIAGQGPTSAAIARTAAALVPEQRRRVALVDRVEPEDMPSFYLGVDYVLVLSRTESQCRVALEAMLAGAIVLARPTEGTRDLIDDGVTGFFVDPTDPELVRSRLAALRTDPSQAEAIRARALQSAEAASARNRREWELFLRSLVASSA